MQILSLSKPRLLGFGVALPHAHPQARKSTRISAFRPAVASASPSTPVAESADAKTDAQTIEEYNKRMALKMGWMDSPYEYYPDKGLYYHYISEDVIVGSQPRTAADIKTLAEENVRAILNLQQDKDLNHWKVNLSEIANAAAEHNVAFFRTPAVDFDPNSLRSILPQAVAALEKARCEHGRVYVHCTAGLGRSPAVAIAALYWFTDMDLDTAYQFLTNIRPCGPNKDAIRGATYDLLTNGHWESFQSLPADAYSSLSDDDRDVIREKLGLGESSRWTSSFEGSESE